MRMWSLQDLLFTLCAALSCVTSAAGLIHASGYEGRQVNISCPYGEGYESYEKYLCRNNCGYDDDVLIRTTGAKKNKYSIHDDREKRTFTATISDLSHTDAGTYWCGVTRTGKDIYTEVKLEVEKDTCCEQSTKVQSYEDGSVSIKCPYKPKDQNSLKYICRGNRSSTCLQQAVITSGSQHKGRFSLTDDKRSSQFTVNVTSLTQRDSGLYLCGVQHTGLDAFSAVELEVKEWCCVKSNKLSGILGRPVTIQCGYPPQHRHNRKFLCKGDRRKNCTDVSTSRSRFTLQDGVSSSSFSVKITGLKAGDAGTYWCGSDSHWSAANYTKIHLSVVSPQQTSTVIHPNTVEEPVTSQPTHIPGKALFHPVVFIVPAVLLVLVCALVVVYKCKYHKVRGAEVNANKNKTKAAETEEVMWAADIYENQDVVVHSKKMTSKPQSTHDHYDDEAQDDSVYQNVTTADNIYCNQTEAKARR